VLVDGGSERTNAQNGSGDCDNRNHSTLARLAALDAMLCRRPRDRDNCRMYELQLRQGSTSERGSSSTAGRICNSPRNNRTDLSASIHSIGSASLKQLRSRLAGSNRSLNVSSSSSNNSVGSTASQELAAAIALVTGEYPDFSFDDADDMNGDEPTIEISTGTHTDTGTGTGTATGNASAFNPNHDTATTTLTTGHDNDNDPIGVSSSAPASVPTSTSHSYHSIASSSTSEMSLSSSSKQHLDLDVNATIVEKND
jgi:type VI secretion system secreted protein VgrG